MSDPANDPWAASIEPATPPVPARYRGVWRRTLLETPERCDDSTWVRWLQLGRWHADLRVPVAARPDPDVSGLRLQQGFAGITEVSAVGPEVCTWHRVVDYQPPGGKPDAGYMIFETPERVIELGVHGVYREVWALLEGSTGLSIALAEPRRDDGLPPARLFFAGRYLMRVRPSAPAWQAAFEISFGQLAGGHWTIERSTRPELEGRQIPVQLARKGADQARLQMDDAGDATWRVLEWTDG